MRYLIGLLVALCAGTPANALVTSISATYGGPSNEQLFMAIGPASVTTVQTTSNVTGNVVTFNLFGDQTAVRPEAAGQVELGAGNFSMFSLQSDPFTAFGDGTFHVVSSGAGMAHFDFSMLGPTVIALPNAFPIVQGDNYFQFRWEPASLRGFNYSQTAPILLVDQFLLGGFTNDLTVPQGIPEPSTWAMMLLGFAAIGFTAHRRRAAKPVPSTLPNPSC